MALSYYKRQEVLERANRKSELDMFTFGDLECSHLSHDKDLIEYDTPEMTVLVSTVQHLAYHLIFENNARLIGLSESDNFKAIRSLSINSRIQATEAGLELGDVIKHIEKAKTYWWYYLEL